MATKKKTSKGASKKHTSPKLVIPPVAGEAKTYPVERSVGIGSPVDEKTLRALKEKARELDCKPEKPTLGKTKNDSE